MDLNDKKRRVFTNNVPSWNVKISYVFAVVLFLIGLFFLYFAYCLRRIEDGIDMFIFILMGSLGIIFCLLPFYLIKNMKKHLQIHSKNELRNDGYYFTYHDKNTNKEYNLFLPFENMEFVLISLGLLPITKPYIDSDGDVEKIYKKQVYAKSHMKGITSDGIEEIVPFSIYEKETFDMWMKIFKEKQVPIYYTEFGLNKILLLTDEILKKIPTKPYEGNLPFTIGKHLFDPHDELEFLTDEQKENVVRRTNYQKLFILSIGLIQIPIISLWMPHAKIEDGYFNGLLYDGFWVFTLFALIFANIVGKRKWYEPLMDIFILIAGATIGTLLVVNATDEFREAIFYNYLPILVFYLPVIYAIKIRDWIRKKLRGSPK